MVLCKFYQQGTCRYGSKCVNEHLDIKQMIKTDIEGAINGKQWPLSTYGPFKDKPSIPNFIEDQSFEEVRLMCYEAKQKNFFDQFHQQFNKEAVEAANKMNALLQMSPDIVEIVMKVYDTPSDTSSCGVTLGKTASNVFGIANSSTANAGSLFAKSTTNTQSNSIFANNSQPSAGTSIFTKTPFSQQQQQQSSIFGQLPKSTNSIFASGNNNAQQNASVFAQQPTQSNLFATTMQQPQPASTATGLFSQQNQFLQPAQNVNIFRQAAQASAQTQQGLFAHAAPMVQQPSQQQQGIFAQAAQQTTAGQGLFAQAAQQTQNMFATAFQQQQQQQQQQQPTNPNIFQQNAPNATSQQQQTNANILQQNQALTGQQQIQQQPSAHYQQASLQTQNTGGQMNQPTEDVRSTPYSRLDDLTPEEIEAFKADCFLPGKIPFNPPPRELIN